MFIHNNRGMLLKSRSCRRPGPTTPQHGSCAPQRELSRGGDSFLRRWQIFSRTERRVLPVSTAAVSWAPRAGRRWHEHMCLVAGALPCCRKDGPYWLGVSSGLEGVKVAGGTSFWGGIPCGRPTGVHLPCTSVLLELPWEHGPEPRELSEVPGRCLLEDRHLCLSWPASFQRGSGAAAPSVLVVPSRGSAALR